MPEQGGAGVFEGEPAGPLEHLDDRPVAVDLDDAAEARLARIEFQGDHLLERHLRHPVERHQRAVDFAEPHKLKHIPALLYSWLSPASLSSISL